MERPLLGVSLIIAAEAILVVTGILIRELGADIGVAQLVFLRNVIGLFYMLVLVSFFSLKFPETFFWWLGIIMIVLWTFFYNYVYSRWFGDQDDY